MMCDIYNDKCEGCYRELPIHLGDFSTGRNNVRGFCPKCHDVLFGKLGFGLGVPMIIFSDEIHTEDASGTIIAGLYLFAVDYPREISLNH